MKKIIILVCAIAAVLITKCTQHMIANLAEQKKVADTTDVSDVLAGRPCLIKITSGTWKDVFGDSTMLEKFYVLGNGVTPAIINTNSGFGSVESFLQVWSDKSWTNIPIYLDLMPRVRATVYHLRGGGKLPVQKYAKIGS